jgi:Protein of unknown function (DUF707)
MTNCSMMQFSENFTILLFHYDGNVDQWDEFEWSKRAIHVGTRKQTKWYDWGNDKATYGSLKLNWALAKP